MAAQFIIFSEREEDVRLAEFAAFANDVPARRVSRAAELGQCLREAPDSVVLWDAGDPRRAEEVAPMLAHAGSLWRVFAVTDDPLHECAHLGRVPAFGHHLLRRYDEPAPTLYARLAGAALRGTPFGIARYFPEATPCRRITLTRSGQKTSAVEAVQNIFTKQNVNTRLSALVAQAVDELLMNAIFDAPVLPNGAPLRRGTERNADFELIQQEHVHVEVATAQDYVGIGVSDQFGSLRKSVLLGFLNKDYHDREYVLRKNDLGAGLGLNGIIQAGLSLIFACKPGVKTEVMLFFKKDATYRDFRGGFRFLSVLAP